MCVCVCVCVTSLLSRCFVFGQLTCQDVSSLGRGVTFCVCVCNLIVVKMLRLWATNLSRCIVFRQGGYFVCVCVCVCVCNLIVVKMLRLWATNLSRCIVFRQGGYFVCVCVCVCVTSLLSRCFVFGQLTCQDVSSLGRGVTFCVCVCNLIVVKMLRLWATNLSRCIVFRQGGYFVCVYVCV